MQPKEMGPSPWYPTPLFPLFLTLAFQYFLLDGLSLFLEHMGKDVRDLSVGSVLPRAQTQALPNFKREVNIGE